LLAASDRPLDTAMPGEHRHALDAVRHRHRDSIPRRPARLLDDLHLLAATSRPFRPMVDTGRARRLGSRRVVHRCGSRCGASPAEPGERVATFR
jgi:hypothetical protein